MYNHSRGRGGSPYSSPPFYGQHSPGIAMNYNRMTPPWTPQYGQPRPTYRSPRSIGLNDSLSTSSSPYNSQSPSQYSSFIDSSFSESPGKGFNKSPNYQPWNQSPNSRGGYRGRGVRPSDANPGDSGDIRDYIEPTMMLDPWRDLEQGMSDRKLNFMSKDGFELVVNAEVEKEA